MLIYDLEIEKAIQGRKEDRLLGIKYCDGWDDHANMGISCICAYDYTEDRYRVFTQSNLETFKDLLQSHTIYVGFNNINFDNKVIKACWNIDIPQEKSFDILRRIWRAAGHDENIFNPSTHGSYGLDACCAANFNIHKSGHGALAPVEWQQAKIGNVIDYCLKDVFLTRMLMDKIVKGGWIIDPKNVANRLYIEGIK